MCSSSPPWKSLLQGHWISPFNDIITPEILTKTFETPKLTKVFSCKSTDCGVDDRDGGSLLKSPLARDLPEKARVSKHSGSKSTSSNHTHDPATRSVSSREL